VAQDLRQAVFDKVLGFSSAEINRFATSSLITRTTNDITQIQAALMLAIRQLIYAPIIGVGGIIRALGRDVSMAWIIALATIVMIGVMFYGLTQIAANGLALYKKSKIMMTNTLISAAFNIVSNFILVPRMGYMAAAYNTVAAYVVLLVLTYVRSEQYMAWQVPWKDIAKITLASTIMGLTVWGVFHSQQPRPLLLVAEVLTGFAVYPIALLLLKAVRPDEKEFIIGLLGKVWRKLGLKRG